MWSISKETTSLLGMKTEGSFYPVFQELLGFPHEKPDQ